jgi:hypothetical protein
VVPKIRIPSTRATLGFCIVIAGTFSAPLCFSGSIADTAARMATAARPGRTARPAPGALNLLPAASAIQSLTRMKAFDEAASERARTGSPYASVGERDGLNLRTAFPIKWESTPANVNPKIVSLARNFRHNGLPVVHLWGSGRNLLAFGLNPHGKPGLYFTQNMD